jgi:antitoxin VapB
MNLNIKNDETHRLAAELAQLTGESMTMAVTEAIRERLEREKRRRGAAALANALMAIGRRCAARPLRDRRSPEEILYDDRGLPAG